MIKDKFHGMYIKIWQLLKVVDQVLLMSVDPGFSGQAFLDSSIERLKSLVARRDQQQLDFEIVMDGGINQDNIATLATLGVDQVAVASGIFAAGDPVKNIEALKKLV